MEYPLPTTTPEGKRIIYYQPSKKPSVYGVRLIDPKTGQPGQSLFMDELTKGKPESEYQFIAITDPAIEASRRRSEEKKYEKEMAEKRKEIAAKPEEEPEIREKEYLIREVGKKEWQPRTALKGRVDIKEVPQQIIEPTLAPPPKDKARLPISPEGQLALRFYDPKTSPQYFPPEAIKREPIPYDVFMSKLGEKIETKEIEAIREKGTLAGFKESFYGTTSTIISPFTTEKKVKRLATVGVGAAGVGALVSLTGPAAPLVGAGVLTTAGAFYIPKAQKKFTEAKWLGPVAYREAIAEESAKTVTAMIGYRVGARAGTQIRAEYRKARFEIKLKNWEKKMIGERWKPDTKKAPSVMERDTGAILKDKQLQLKTKQTDYYRDIQKKVLGEDYFTKQRYFKDIFKPTPDKKITFEKQLESGKWISPYRKTTQTRLVGELDIYKKTELGKAVKVGKREISLFEEEEEIAGLLEELTYKAKDVWGDYVKDVKLTEPYTVPRSDVVIQPPKTQIIGYPISIFDTKKGFDLWGTTKEIEMPPLFKVTPISRQETAQRLEQKRKSQFLLIHKRMQNLLSAQSEIQVPITEQILGPDVIPKRKVRQEIIPISITEQILKTDLIPIPKTPPITILEPPTKYEPVEPSKPIPFPAIPIIPPFPKFPRRVRRVKKKKKKLKRRYGYKPTVEAHFRRIFGKPLLPKEMTGLEVRPVPYKFKKYFKKPTYRFKKYFKKPKMPFRVRKRR